MNAAKRLCRRADPPTSVAAAAKAAKASPAAIAAVLGVMSDGRERIDEEIWIDTRASGYISAFDTVRHGRLALSESQVLVDTGRTAATSNGSQATVWALSTDNETVEAASNSCVVWTAALKVERERPPSVEEMMAADGEIGMLLDMAGWEASPQLQRVREWMRRSA